MKTIFCADKAFKKKKILQQFESNLAYIWLNEKKCLQFHKNGTVKCINWIRIKTNIY